MQKQKKSYLGIIILAALVLGVITGILLRNNAQFTTDYFKPFGDIYLNLLKLLIVPVVLFSIIDGIVSLDDVKRVGSIGWKTVVFFLATTAFAIVIGLATAYVFRGVFPVLNVAESMTDGALEKVETAKNTAASTSFISLIQSIFPSNAVEPLLQTSMLATIFIAAIFGIGILMAGEEGNRVAENVHSIYAVVMKVMNIIMWLTPLGVFLLMANVIAVNGIQILSALGFVILAAYVAYILHIVIVYGLSLSLVAKINPITFLKKMFPAMTTAFTTTSSNATLPLTIECTNELGAEKEVSAFALPLGCTINMDGAAIYMGVVTVFIAKCYGIELTLAQLITIVLTATLASVGSAGVSGAAMVMVAMVLESVGLPVEGIALVVGVDKLFDMGRTLLNVTGDSVCTLCVDRIEKNKRLRKYGKK